MTYTAASEQGDLCPLFQREDPLVFQEDHSLGGRFPGECADFLLPGGNVQVQLTGIMLHTAASPFFG